jgi:hypothetical protein
MHCDDAGHEYFAQVEGEKEGFAIYPAFILLTYALDAVDSG